MLRVKFKKSLNERKKTGEIWRKLPDQKATKKYIYPTSRKNLPNLKGWFTGTLEEIEGVLTLYHRTNEDPQKIENEGFTSKIFTSFGNEIYFSDTRDGQGTGYGENIVVVEIPEEYANLDDEFPSGEKHYWVSAKNLKKYGKIINSTTEGNTRHKIVSFDFDDTLTYAPFDPEEGDFVYQGPHEDMIDKIRYYIKNKEVTVYVVTSRIKSDSPDPYGDISVEEFLDKHDLKVDGIYYTNGKLKAETLKELGVTLHHDDDSKENYAANALGIQTVASDPYGLYDKY